MSIVSRDEIASVDNLQLLNQKQITPELYEWIRRELKIDQNELLKDNTKLSKELIRMFAEYEDAISRN